MQLKGQAAERTMRKHLWNCHYDDAFTNENAVQMMK